MATLFSRLVSWGIFALIGLGILAYMIWSWGPVIRFGNVAPLASVQSRVITIVAIYAIWGLLRLFRAWRDRKKSTEISNDLAASVDPADEQSGEELATLKERFDEALKILKKSTSGGKKMRSIYQLPWYMIIGPPGSGKTTLLVNSGLQFPLADSMGLSKIQGIGGTRNCDWWFTDEAVLIDTAGRYTTQDSNQKVDNKAWFGFLSLLKKHRRRRPINGIILAISMEELARQSQLERERNAAAISSRIQELYEQLGIRFPIYLMFTKCDLMAGFMEFFQDLDRHERAQVWGFTLGLQDSPIERFDAEFTALQEQLESRVVQRLQDERDVTRRELIYNFPMQLAATRQSIEEFLQSVFKPSRYTSSHLLRGVYFTSGTQEGTPFNRIMSQLARNFSLSRAATQSSPSKGKSYFISDLMSKVIFGESGLAGANMKVERIYGAAKRIGFMLIVSLPILLNLGWWMSYANNKTLADQVNEAAEVVLETSTKVSPQSTSLASVLELLNEARSMPTGYVARDESAPISQRIGLSQYKGLGRNGAIPAYERLLEKSFLSRLMVRMEQVMKQSQNDPDKAYQVLKAYLMLGDPEHMETEFVRNWVHEDWQENLSRALSADQLAQLKEHLEALLELEPLALPFDMDHNLVMTIRDALSRITLAERIYTVIRSDHLQDGKPFTIASASGNNGARVFDRVSGTPINQGVPAFFSPEGYHQMYLPAEDTKVEQMEDESWIFATEADGADLQSATDLKNDIRRLYFRDYTNTWLEFLEDIRIRPFASLAEAASILLILTGDDSPLRILLVESSRATRLAPEVVVSDEASEGSSLRQKIESIFARNIDRSDLLLDPAIVDQSFASLHALSTAQPGGQSPVDGLLADLELLYLYLQGLAQSSKDQLATGLQSQAGDAIERVRFRARRTPPPISAWVMQMASQSHDLVAGGTTAAIKAAWAADVAPICQQTLNGRYPFDNAAREVQLRDFSVFFGPGGTLDKFFKSYLANYVDTTSREWKLKSNVAGSINISGSALRQLQRGNEIQKAFFTGGGAGPSISFVMRPVRMDEVTTDFMLNINGQTTTYDHGPQYSDSFEWPGASGANRVQLQFNSQTGGGRVGDTRDGPWAFFQLLEASGMEVSPNEPEKFETQFKLGERWIRYEVVSNSAYNPFSLPALRAFRCPDQL